MQPETAAITTELLRALGDLGPWGAAGLYIFWQMKVGKKIPANGSVHRIDLGEVIGVQEEQGKLLEKVEKYGTVPFQRYKADNDQWKVSRVAFEERHSSQVGDAHKRIEVLKERIGGLVTTHNLIHPDQKVI